MYAVVEYNDYRKEQSFEVILTTDDVEYAKKLAFQNAKKALPDDEWNYKITSKFDNSHLRPINRKVIAYKIICVEKCKKGYKLQSTYSGVYAVIELKKHAIQPVEDIDTSMICDNYYDYDYDEEEDEDDE